MDEVPDGPGLGRGDGFFVWLWPLLLSSQEVPWRRETQVITLSPIFPTTCPERRVPPCASLMTVTTTIPCIRSFLCSTTARNCRRAVIARLVQTAFCRKT